MIDQEVAWSQSVAFTDAGLLILQEHLRLELSAFMECAATVRAARPGICSSQLSRSLGLG